MFVCLHLRIQVIRLDFQILSHILLLRRRVFDNPFRSFPPFHSFTFIRLVLGSWDLAFRLLVQIASLNCLYIVSEMATESKVGDSGSNSAQCLWIVLAGTCLLVSLDMDSTFLKALMAYEPS
jgi:uncharacterized membrane protein (UPF0182 family)